MLTVAQQHAANKLRRRGLKQLESGEIVPMTDEEKADGSAVDTPATETQAAVETTEDNVPAPQDNEWKNRFEKLEADHKALLGRMAPAQRDADTFRSLYETSSQELSRTREELSTQLNDLTAQLNAAQTAKQQRSIQEEIDALLDDDDKQNVDPAVLAVIRKVAGASFSKRAPEVDHRAIVQRELAEREHQSAESYRRGLLNDPAREVGNISKWSQDPEFLDYCLEHPEVDTTIENFLKASSTANIDRFAKATDRLITAYKATKSAPVVTRVADPKGSPSVLQQALSRTASVKLTEAEARKLANEYKQLIRNRDPVSRRRADEIMAQLDAA